ncbi:hypothetical protein CVIRNUC_008048 [Coccomyxa viridis]|uniref:NAD(P)-binding domain-containing protein n=1 Tax=Coccomyxa viridis TaxID=1274662 RepID=A0AAV1IG12_9CHLO|nr:hypothetical protein CVIRNUC_008048 [Coccomyxa viridis]
MQACSRTSLVGCRAEAMAAPACLPRASLRPVPLPANRCFVSKNPHGASLPARCRTRLSPQAAATAATTRSLAVFGSASGDVFIAGATGPLGARITQELLLSGFKVTAGMRWGTSLTQYLHPLMD